MTKAQWRGIRVGLTVLLGLVLLVACGDEGGVEVTEEEVPAIEPPAPVPEPPSTWPLFRGDANMTGISEDPITPPLELAWTFEAGAPVPATAVIAEGTVFIGSFDGYFYALDLESGDLRWKFPVELGVEGPACYLEGLICFGGSDGFVYGLDAQTGEARWTYETGDSIVGGLNAFPSSSGKTLLLVGSDDFYLHAIDFATGEKVWEVETGNYVKGAPSVDRDGGVVIFGGCDEVLRLIDAESGELVRQVEIGAYMGNSCAVRDQIAYLAHYAGEVLAVDLVNGETVWTHEAGGTEFLASPAVSEDRVFAAGRDQKLRCLNRNTGELIWEFSARKGMDSSPVVAPNAVFLGSDDGRLYALNPTDGTELWSYDLASRINSSPAIAAGYLVIASQGGSIFCFREAES